jgi:tetratricopeptide (TPR) repeat protein
MQPGLGGLAVSNVKKEDPVVGPALASPLEMGREEGAIRMLNRALEIDEYDVRARIQLALIYSQTGRSSQSLTELRRAVKTDPPRPDAVLALAAVLQDQSEMGEAERVLRTEHDHAEATEADYASVRTAQAALEARGWRSSSLNEAVEDWSGLVATVERGYRMTIDDYTNDLAIRGWLEEARPFLTERVRASLDARLGPIDERFRAATRHTSRRLPGAGPGWWYRLPKQPLDELAEDIVRMDL